MRSIPKDKTAGFLLLGAISGAFLFTIGSAVFRTSSLNKNPSNGRLTADAFNHPGVIAAKLPTRFIPRIHLLPMSQVSLIAIASPTESNIYNLPKIGKVTYQSSQPQGEGRYVFLQGPPGMCDGGVRRRGFDSNIHFKSYPLVPLTIEPTSRLDVGVVRIPASYPETVDHGTLTVNQDNHLPASWYISDLPRTRELWNPSTLPQNEMFGPLEVEAKAWRDESFPIGKVMVEMVTHDLRKSTCDEKADGRDTWVITRSSGMPSPRFGAGGAAAERFAFTASSTPLKAVPDTWLEDLSYASIQGFLQLQGRMIHYRTYEEKLTFPQARLVKVGGTPTNPIYTIGRKPISGATSEGSQVILYPITSGKEAGNKASYPRTIFKYRVQNSDPRGYVKTWITGLSTSQAPGETSRPGSNSFGEAKVRCEIRWDDRADKGLTLLLHRTVEVEERPYRIAVPIENMHRRYSREDYVAQAAPDCPPASN